MTLMATIRRARLTTLAWRALPLALLLAVSTPAGAAICLNCGGGGTPPPPPPPVADSWPDMVLQFSPCLVSPTQTYVISGIKDGLVSSLKALDLKHDDPSPNPDVREACINGRDVIAAWFVPTLGYGSWDTSAARTQAMGKTNILQAPETFAINLSKNGLDRMVNVAWRDIPKLSDATGQPNANGPIHLLDERTDLYNAVYRIPTMKEALLTVHGFYDGPTADTDSWAYVEDVMYLSNGHIECDTNVDVDLEPTFD